VKRHLLVLPFALVALASGCGSSDAGGDVDESDLPGTALACLEENDIPAQRTGKDDNELVLDAGPRIKFFLTADEAISEQFRGREEGTEQIGTALLYVDPETSETQDDVLHDVELCLADL
jgi:hypothetical protein